MITHEERQVLSKARAIKSRERKAAKVARPKPVRPVAPGQRQPRLIDNTYLAFIRRHPCCVCHKAAPSQAAHVRSGYAEASWRPTGMQEKPDDRPRTLPLCASCHLTGPKAQHNSKERDWWASHGIYPPELAARFEAEYHAIAQSQ